MFLAALTIEYRTIYYKDASQEREYKIFMILVTGRYKYTVMNLLRSYIFNIFNKRYFNNMIHYNSSCFGLIYLRTYGDY